MELVTLARNKLVRLATVTS